MLVHTNGSPERVDCDGTDSACSRSVGRTHPSTKYVGIAAELRDEIRAGRYRERLPSESALMERFGVARMTVRRAMRTLQDEGLVAGVHGKGVFVTPNRNGCGSADRAQSRSVGRSYPSTKYVGIAAELRDEIRAGRYRERLPSESALMERFGVARMTVRRAMRTLQDEGLAAGVHGKGVFVTPSWTVSLTSTSALLCDLIRGFPAGDPRRSHLATAIRAIEMAMTFEGGRDQPPCSEVDVQNRGGRGSRSATDEAAETITETGEAERG